MVAGTIQVALLCYFSTLAWVFGSGKSLRSPPLGCSLLWAAGCFAYFLHMAAAFHYVHDWSHQAAVQHTIDQTQRLVGIHFEGGIYFNYAFGIVWLVDCWSSFAVGWQQSQRPLRMLLLVHGFMAFMVINGAIVFADGITRWASVAGFAVVAVLAVRSFMRGPWMVD